MDTGLEIGLTTLVVSDYDAGIDYFVNTLGFQLCEDIHLSGGKRWVVVSPNHSRHGLLLAKAVNDEQAKAIGNQVGGRVGFFLYTDNFKKTYDSFARKGVKFCETPRYESYGTVVVFEDIFGNRWDLLQRSE